MEIGFQELEEEGKTVGLEINENKTKYMITSRNQDKWNKIDNIQMGSHKFERVSKCKYLGTIITKDNVIPS